jgi:hypothetical protein
MVEPLVDGQILDELEDQRNVAFDGSADLERFHACDHTG